MAVSKISSRTYKITSADHGNFLELGPAATSGQMGAFVLQFDPAAGWDGTLVLYARPFGQAADATNVPFLPVPYRRIALGAGNAVVAADYQLVSDALVGEALIQVPANGLSIAILVAASQGACTMVSWPLQGTSAI